MADMILGSSCNCKLAFRESEVGRVNVDESK